MLNFRFLLFHALLLFFNKNEHHYSKKSQMSQHFSTLQNITEQIINSTLVLHFFSTWENNLKNFLQKSSFVQFKDHSVHNFHEVLKNFSATLTWRKKVHKTGLKMLFKCSELCSVSWKSSWQRHVANWKFVVIIIMAKLSKVSKLLKGWVI